MAKFELKGKYTDGSDWTAGTFDVPTSLPNAVCEIKNKNDISTAPKKYAHNITVAGTNARVSFTLYTTHPNAYSNILTVKMNASLGELQRYPAAGEATVVGITSIIYAIQLTSGDLYAVSGTGGALLNNDQPVSDIVVPL